jgi:hypothetical protein
VTADKTELKRELPAQAGYADGADKTNTFGDAVEGGPTDRKQTTTNDRKTTE